jgi:hypothetical protein
MEITNNTSITVDAYQSTYGLQLSSGNAQTGDSVQLSPSAQIAAMHTDGMTVNQIAANAGLTTAEVDSYLGITTTVTPAGGGHAPAKGGGETHAASGASGTSSSTAAQTTKKAAA